MAAAAEAITYIDVDTLPEVAAARDEVRTEAQATIEANRRRKQQGEYVPLPVDALSDADAVWAARAEFGEHSPEARERYDGLWLSCHRLTTEWLRKLTDEYFPRVYRGFDPETEDFFSHGFYIGQMTHNALTPQEHPEFETLRVHERVAQATPHLVRKLGGVAVEGTRIRNISECAAQAIKAYEQDFAAGRKHQGYNGFVPEIEKVMIYDFIYDPESEGRFDEQIALPGVYLSHEVIQEALRRRNLDVSSKDRTDLLGTQMLANDDLIEFVKHLDEVGSELRGVNLFKGSVVSADHPKNYDAIREEAALRQEQLKAHSTMVADFVLMLSENKTNPRQAVREVEEFVKQMLLRLAQDDITIAEQAFDKQTAEGMRHVSQLYAEGREQEAYDLFQKVSDEAPGGGFCGAGSCDLVDVRSSGSAANDAKKLGFNPKDTLKFGGGKCKCGAKDVYFDLKQAKKGCAACGKTVKY
ncbi:MAG TPA: hypothetical protein VG992_03005 [Candidatus Saccharimonadales bacterium]|nr:hypothetical protein [Candidatus Saccharimonadales bacterium]